MPRKKYGIPEWATLLRGQPEPNPPYAHTEPIPIDGGELHLEWWHEEGAYGVINTDDGERLVVTPRQLLQIHDALNTIRPLLEEIAEGQ